MGQLKCDHNKRLIPLTSDCIEYEVLNHVIDSFKDQISLSILKDLVELIAGLRGAF
jgi:hypothetical protein